MRTTDQQKMIDEAIEILKSELTNTNAVMESSAGVKQYLRLNYAALSNEVFVVLHLDKQYRLIEDEVIFKGSIDGISVYSREVVKSCLEKNSAAVIFAHNHPSGECLPSVSDKRLTEKLVAALSLFDIRVRDHLVIGTEAYSFAENGLL